MFIPTHREEGLPGAELATAPVRSGSTLNPTYYTLTPSRFSEFDALVFLASTSYPRRAQPLTSWSAG